jgi:IS30 family transposase
MPRYKQMSKKEREELFLMLNDKKNRSEMAKALRRDKSTISRELGRNTASSRIGYLPDTAHDLAQKRKAKHGCKVDRHPELKESIDEKLRIGWSPGAIAGRMKLDGNSTTISQEAVYQYVYSNDGKSKGLFRFLLRSRPTRGKLHGRTPRKTTIPERISIHDRPEYINSREEFGHFEGDLIFCEGSQSTSITTLVERTTRFVQLVKNPSKHSAVVISGAFNKLASLPEEARLSLTLDNGVEFTRHTLLRNKLNMLTYFCDKHSPWQKGQIEKTNAILRRYIPWKRSIDQISTSELLEIENRFNDVPRKCLGYKTPREAFNEKLAQGDALNKQKRNVTSVAEIYPAMHLKTPGASRLSPLGDFGQKPLENNLRC